MGLLGPERLGRIELVVVRRRRAAACRPRLALDAFSFARVRVSARVLRLRFDYPGRGPLNALVTTRRPGAEAARLRVGADRVSVGKLQRPVGPPDAQVHGAPAVGLRPWAAARPAAPSPSPRRGGTGRTATP